MSDEQEYTKQEKQEDFKTVVKLLRKLGIRNAFKAVNKIITEEGTALILNKAEKDWEAFASKFETQESARKFLMDSMQKKILSKFNAAASRQDNKEKDKSGKNFKKRLEVPDDED